MLTLAAQNTTTLEALSTKLLLLPCLLILCVGFAITWQTRFIQLRALPLMFTLFFRQQEREHYGRKAEHSVSARKALFTAMSTTLGMASILSPIIAIRLGGPGALFGFFLATLVGTAISYAEVTFAVSYRKRLDDGQIMGGPMQYLERAFHPYLAKFYALSTMTLLLMWSSTQSNTLADLLTTHSIPQVWTGAILALLIFIALLGGIRRIGNISAKLVPVMFVFYTSACLWIFISHWRDLPAVFLLIFESATSFHDVSYGFVIGGLLPALRWGLLKGVQGSEAGVGTSTIPHSMAQTDSATQQGLLSMVSIYTQGFLSFISGTATLLAGTWNQAELPLGIHIVLATFEKHFAGGGTFIVNICVLLFAYGTILGNNYNGSQCFTYLTRNRGLVMYHIFTCLIVFLGAVLDVEFLWVIVDFFIIPTIVPHTICLWILCRRKKEVLFTT